MAFPLTHSRTTQPIWNFQKPLPFSSHIPHQYSWLQPRHRQAEANTSEPELLWYDSIWLLSWCYYCHVYGKILLKQINEETATQHQTNHVIPHIHLALRKRPDTKLFHFFNALNIPGLAHASQGSHLHKLPIQPVFLLRRFLSTTEFFSLICNTDTVIHTVL